MTLQNMKSANRENAIEIEMLANKRCEKKSYSTTVLKKVSRLILQIFQYLKAT